MIEFSVNGIYDMTILDFASKKEVEPWIAQGVSDNLQQGEYVISINTNLIYDINNMERPLYRFSLDATDHVEYNFD